MNSLTPERREYAVHVHTNFIYVNLFKNKDYPLGKKKKKTVDPLTKSTSNNLKVIVMLYARLSVFTAYFFQDDDF